MVTKFSYQGYDYEDPPKINEYEGRFLHAWFTDWNDAVWHGARHELRIISIELDTNINHWAGVYDIWSARTRARDNYGYTIE
jgi:hypothetical protein